MKHFGGDRTRFVSPATSPKFHAFCLQTLPGSRFPGGIAHKGSCCFLSPLLRRG
jgi:hypothetical protein